MREAVVLVHGIWMRGGSLLVIARRLESAGYVCHPFTYASVRRTAAENADRLQVFSARLDADIVHFVGHSLGGIVILHLFDRHPWQRPGRVVFLGSPVNGSAVAHVGGEQPHRVEMGILGQDRASQQCGRPAQCREAAHSSAARSKPAARVAGCHTRLARGA